jgi:Fur family peroxide stress response transcriptional regulator
MDPQQEPINSVIIRLRERGYRLTPQRMTVLKTLIGSQEHLSVEEIYERIRIDYPMTGLATIYKTVALLKEMGVISELNLSGSNTRYDGSNNGPHPHFVCDVCHAIIDLDNGILKDLAETVAERSGYQIVKTRLDFFGTCPNCQSG